MATKTLEEFVENYIKNLKISGTPLDLDTYTRSKGITANEDYKSAVLQAVIKRKQSLPKGGTEGERVRDMGLSGSGYQKYLLDTVRREYESDITAAGSAREEAITKALGGYTEYLNNFAKREADLRSTVTKQLLDRNVMNFDTAYTYAVNAGLSDSDAKKISEQVYISNRQKMMKQVIDQIMTLRLDKTTAALYAKAVGFNDEDVAYVQSVADRYFDLLDKNSDEYRDELEKLENKANKFN